VAADPITGSVDAPSRTFDSDFLDTLAQRVVIADGGDGHDAAGGR
jgi:hypothetical protein